MSVQLASGSDPLPAGNEVPRGLVSRLAVADLRHEWVLSLCLAASLAAVLAPLLLLFGLKFGTIETMRDRLIQDPLNREIIPAQAGSYTAGWIKQLAQRPEVGFVMPTINRGATNVRVVKPGSRDSVEIEAVPTASGDPIVAENGLPSPKEDEALLSTEALEQLGAKVGDTLHVRANRFAPREEIVETQFRLIGVLPPRADPKPRIYALLQFTIDVEAYRRGEPVQSRGWPGAIQPAIPNYDGVYIAVDRPFDAVGRLNVMIGTGFQELAELTPAEFTQRTGFPVNPGFNIYDLHVVRQPTGPASVSGVREGLRGYNAILIPYVRGVTLTIGGGAQLPVVGWSLSNDDAARLGSTAPPWQVPSGSAAFENIAQVLLPAASGLNEATQTVTAETMLGKPNFPLSVAGSGPDGKAVVPAVLAGMIRAGAQREILYDANAKALVLGRVGYGGFRLYARTIDDVLALTTWLREQDIPFTSKAQDIDRIRVLDRGLTRMFWLVAVVGIVGGVAALIASWYASVQRKRRELGMMRLLGIPRQSVFLFPIYQSFVLASAGASLALVAYFLLASVINSVFASDLNLGQKICRLPVSYLAAAVIAMLIAAVLCALLAASHTTRIDPAEAIRDE